MRPILCLLVALTAAPATAYTLDSPEGLAVLGVYALLPITEPTLPDWVIELRPLDGSLWAGESCHTDSDCELMAGEPLIPGLEN